MPTIDTSRMLPVGKFGDKRSEDRLCLAALACEARRFLTSQEWCREVLTQWLDIHNEGVYAVFYFTLVPRGDDADDEVWVIVGDLPPAYVDAKSNPNGACALAGYVHEMNRWVEAVKEGNSTDGLIPVNTASTLDYAEMLEERLDFITNEILPLYSKGLGEAPGPLC